AVDQLPVPERKDLHGGTVLLARDPDHVDRPHGALVGRLPLGEMAYREQTIPVSRRLLEALLVGRPLHLLLELAHDRAGLAGEELDHAVDHGPVVLLRDVSDARRQAALDVVVEARNPRVTPGLRPLARAVREDAVEDVESLAHLLRV